MLHFVSDTFYDFWAFVKRPGDDRDDMQATSYRAKRLFSLLAIDIVAMMILMPMVNMCFKLAHLNLENHKLNLLLHWYPVWAIILLAVVILPFAEELIFRLYLRFNRNYILLFASWLFSLVGKQPPVNTRASIETLWRKHFRWVFYFSALLFGLVHITNFEYSRAILFILPVVVAPQIVVGLFAGYLRVKFNLFWGYGMHALHNAIFLAIPLCMMAGIVEKLHVKNNRYSLSIVEPGRKLHKSTHTVSTGLVEVENESLGEVVSFLLEKDLAYLTSNNETKFNKVVSVNFRNHLTDDSQNKKIVFAELTKLYHFKVSTQIRQQKAWTIVVADTLLLLKNKSAPSITNIVTTSSDTISIRNGSIRSLAQSITTTYGKRIRYTVKDSRNFNFAISVGDFEGLQKVLKSKYGLSLDSTLCDFEYTRLEFANDKF